MEELRDRIINLIAIKHKSVIEIGMDDDFIEGCGIDSLSFIKLVSDLEKEFKIIIIDEKFSVDRICTINKLSEYINERLS